MNETIFTEICTKHGFNVDKGLADWTGAGDLYIAVAVYDPDDEYGAEVCTLLKNIDGKLIPDATKYVQTAEELEQACAELNLQIKEFLEQIKMEQIKKDF